jgi:hypothetical protein
VGAQFLRLQGRKMKLDSPAADEKSIIRGGLGVKEVYRRASNRDRSLEAVDPLKRESRLGFIGSVPLMLEDGLISPILAKFSPANELRGEFVGGC